MRKIALVLFVFLQLSCTTTAPKLDEPLRYYLFEVSLSARSPESLAQYYSTRLGFSLERKGSDTYLPLGGGSRIHILGSNQGSSRSSEFEGVKIRITRLDLFKDRMKQLQMPFAEKNFKDPLSGQNFTEISFPENPKLSRIRFVAYQHNSVIGSQSYRPHLNSAHSLREVWLVIGDLKEDVEAFEQILGGREQDLILQPLRVKSKVLSMDRGDLVFIQRSHLESEDRGLVGSENYEGIGFSLGIQSVQQADRVMQRNTSVRYATTRYNSKSCVLISPKNAFGHWLELSQFRP